MACLSVVRQTITWTMLTYCQLDPNEQTSVAFESKCNYFIKSKHLDMLDMLDLQNGGDSMMALSNKSFVRVIGSLCGEFTGHLLIHLSKGQ